MMSSMKAWRGGDGLTPAAAEAVVSQVVDFSTTVAADVKSAQGDHCSTGGQVMK